MLRYTYTSGSLYCCTSGHVTLSKITLSHHGVGVDIITQRHLTFVDAMKQKRLILRNNNIPLFVLFFKLTITKFHI